jgi:hypothetical protein
LRSGGGRAFSARNSQWTGITRVGMRGGAARAVRAL